MMYIINAIIMLWLGVMWSKDDWTNFLLKILFIAVFLANAFDALQAFGWIVRGV